MTHVIEQFIDTIATLRSDRGCAWMRAQTHTSLIKFLIEETYEAVYEIEKDNPKKLCQELGDILLQVVLHAQLATENKHFTFEDVIKTIDHKMRTRNPHVFKNPQQLSLEDIDKQWETIKMQETSISTEEKRYHNMASTGPATRQAEAIGYEAKELNFDWSHINDVLDKLQEEVDEVKDAVSTGDLAHTQEELGDLYFTIAQVCRHLNFDPEETAKQGNLKFLRRFQKLQNLAAEADLDLKSSTHTELENLWKEVKKH